MFESLDGASVAATRQKAGMFLKLAPGGVGLGGVNSPAATGFARVMVVFGRVSEVKLSHDDAADNGRGNIDGAKKSAMNLDAILMERCLMSNGMWSVPIQP